MEGAWFMRIALSGDGGPWVIEPAQILKQSTHAIPNRGLACRMRLSMACRQGQAHGAGRILPKQVCRDCRRPLASSNARRAKTAMP